MIFPIIFLIFLKPKENHKEVALWKRMSLSYRRGERASQLRYLELGGKESIIKMFEYPNAGSGLFGINTLHGEKELQSATLVSNLHLIGEHSDKVGGFLRRSGRRDLSGAGRGEAGGGTLDAEGDTAPTMVEEKGQIGSRVVLDNTIHSFHNGNGNSSIIINNMIIVTYCPYETLHLWEIVYICLNNKFFHFITLLKHRLQRYEIFFIILIYLSEFIEIIVYLILIIGREGRGYGAEKLHILIL